MRMWRLYLHECSLTAGIITTQLIIAIIHEKDINDILINY